jgi:hypothetical protein
MPTEEEIAAACKEVLAGLDEDTLEYLAGGVGDMLEEGKDEYLEYVAPLLEELCGGDDDAARAKAEALWDKLTGGGGNAGGGGSGSGSGSGSRNVAGSGSVGDAPAPLKIRAPISLGGGTSR